jgi:hypothetical protein
VGIKNLKNQKKMRGVGAYIYIIERKQKTRSRGVLVFGVSIPLSQVLPKFEPFNSDFIIIFSNSRTFGSGF